MREIYKRRGGSCCQSWTNCKGSEIISDLFDTIIEACEIFWGKSLPEVLYDEDDGRVVFSIPPNRFSDLGLLNQNVEIWNSLAGILSRPCLHRAWVFQEVAVAETVTVVCGSWEMSWRDWTEALLAITSARLPFAINTPSRLKCNMEIELDQ